MPLRDIKIGSKSRGHLELPLHHPPIHDLSSLLEPFPRSQLPFPPPKKPHPPFSISWPPIPASRYASNDMVLCQAKVKSVLSGDSFVLCSTNDPEKERVFSFAYVTAPRLHREGDEPNAFEARDYLRKLCVGKHCQFEVLYTTPTTKRDHGVLFLNDGQKLLEVMLEAGWVKLRDDAGKKEDSERALLHLEQLRLLEAQAKSEERGIWQPGGKAIVVTDVSDAKKFLAEHKNKRIPSIVEKVLSGDRSLVRLLLDDSHHVQSK